MRGLIRETIERLEHLKPGSLRDAVLISAACRIGHFEIAAYQVAKELAGHLGFDDDIPLLLESLMEENEAEDLLTGIAAGGRFLEKGNTAAVH